MESTFLQNPSRTTASPTAHIDTVKSHSFMFYATAVTLSQQALGYRPRATQGAVPASLCQNALQLASTRHLILPVFLLQETLFKTYSCFTNIKRGFREAEHSFLAFRTPRQPLSTTDHSEKQSVHTRAHTHKPINMCRTALRTHEGPWFTL